MKCCRVLVYVVSRVNVLKAVYIYILLTLLFLHRVFQALVRCKRFINTLLHYITHYMHECMSVFIHACMPVCTHTHMSVRAQTCVSH